MLPINPVFGANKSIISVSGVLNNPCYKQMFS